MNIVYMKDWNGSLSSESKWLICAYTDQICVTVDSPFGEQGQLKMETSFFTNELEFYLLAILTYSHAHRHGGRYLWLW